MNLRFTFRGTQFDIPCEDGDERFVGIFDMLKELFDIRPESCQIVYQGKKISPYAIIKDVVTDHILSAKNRKRKTLRKTPSTRHATRQRRTQGRDTTLDFLARDSALVASLDVDRRILKPEERR